MIYLITYDLRVPGQNYSDLIKEIKAIANGWAKPCESTWIVKSSLTSEAIVNRLTAIDATDKEGKNPPSPTVTSVYMFLKIDFFPF